jgi:CPA1 family monovalent cation:H+ antiporter
VVTELSQFAVLLFVSALVAILTRRLGMPYTVGLVLAGMGFYLLPVHPSLELSQDLVYSVFLPPLVFEAAFYLRWDDLRKDLPVLAALATVGVVLAAAVTAVGMRLTASWPWSSAVLFGVLIAATDPVSVIATFKEAGVRGRVRLLMEAESLLNDGTAAVAFALALGVATGADASPSSIVVGMVVTIGGGVLIGASVGFALMLLAGRSEDHLVAISLTTLAAYGSFHVAEHFHASGVLAALAAGLVTGNFGALGSASARGREAVESFWEYAAFVVNSFIFILIGAEVVKQRFGALWIPILAAILLVTLGRAVSIYPLCALFSATRLRVDMRQQHVLFWGGLRGALALALALGLPASVPRHRELVTVTFAVVAFSIFVQGLTMVPLLRRLGQLSAPR